MKIENSFDVPVPASEAWAMLMNIEEVVGCLPGAQLGEVVDASTYKGTFKARIGPIAVTLAGTVEFVERDEVRRVGRLKGQASDTRGRGGAVSLIAFQLRENAEHTQVDIQTDLQLSGALAQYGRGPAWCRTSPDGSSVSSRSVFALASNGRRRLPKPAPRGLRTAHPRSTWDGWDSMRWSTP